MSKDFQTIDTPMECDGKEHDQSFQRDDFQYFEKSGLDKKHDSEGEESSSGKLTSDPSGQKSESMSMIVTDLEKGHTLINEEQTNESDTGSNKSWYLQEAVNLNESTRIEMNARRQPSDGLEIHQEVGNSTIPMVPVVPMDGTTENVNRVHLAPQTNRERMHPMERKGSRPWKSILLKLALVLIVIAAVIVGTVCGLGKCKADSSSQSKVPNHNRLLDLLTFLRMNLYHLKRNPHSPGSKRLRLQRSCMMQWMLICKLLEWKLPTNPR
jgi:hypothetical protein